MNEKLKALVERLRDPHSGTWPKLKAECASALEAMGAELLVKDAQLDALHREERALSDACVSLRLQVEALTKIIGRALPAIEANTADGYLISQMRAAMGEPKP